jgi:hypothetical protein
MMHWFRRKLKPISRGLLSTLVALWLIAGAAPCVMAESHPMNHASVHCPMHNGVMNMVADDCGPVTVVSCQMPDLQSPLAAALGDMAVTPVLLTVLPIAIALPDNRVPLRHDFFTPDFPAPPLHIQHLTLIL